MATTPLPYAPELTTALSAIHSASLLTKSVLRSLNHSVSAETKADDSPVTIADFAAQAILISQLHAAYPDDKFVGEESADALRQNEQLAERVWELVVRAKDAGGDETAFPKTKEAMFDLIDLGGKNDVTGEGRVWVMDPVDGTATFMEGKQYAVALCLLVNGAQQVGVVGCPNLAFDTTSPLRDTEIHEERVDGEGYGVVLSAVKGQGTYVREMKSSGFGEPRRVDLSTLPMKKPADLKFVETTLNKTSLSQPEHQLVAQTLSASWPGPILWSQQMKYVALTLGAADVMVRIPKTVSRYTYIWDHAGGHILYEEAGGRIRDFDGGRVEFGKGRKIVGEVNYGMIGAMPGVLREVERAVTEVLGRREEGW